MLHLKTHLMGNFRTFAQISLLSTPQDAKVSVYVEKGMECGFNPSCACHCLPNLPTSLPDSDLVLIGYAAQASKLKLISSRGHFGSNCSWKEHETHF